MHRWYSLAAASILFVSGFAAAQSDPHAVQPGPGITVEFPGGTVTQYIAALKKAAPGVPVNAIVSEQAGEQTLPAISLKSVSPYVALTAVASAAGQSGDWQIHAIEEPGTALISAVSIDFLGGDRGGRGLEVFSTQDLLSGASAVSPDVLLTAVDTALQMQGGSRAAKADVMFHKDSGLLLVRGTGSQVHAVSQVIGRLENDTLRRGKEASRSRQVTANQQAEIKKSEVRVRLAQQRLGAYEEQLGETEQLVKAGSASTSDLRELQQRWAQAQAEYDIAKIDFDRARAEAEAGADMANTDDVDQLRATIAQLQAEVQALRQELNDRKGDGNERKGGGTR